MSAECHRLQLKSSQLDDREIADLAIKAFELRKAFPRGYADYASNAQSLRSRAPRPD